MKNKKFKKGIIDQVFIYILSAIIIVLIGFFVVKFLIGFSSSSKQEEINLFYEHLNNFYDSVYSNYDSQKVVNLKLPSNIDYVCFIDLTKIKESDNINKLLDVIKVNKQNLENMINTKNNLILVKDNAIIGKKNIKTFYIKNETGFICIKNNYLTPIKLVITNDDNKIFFSKLENE